MFFDKNTWAPFVQVCGLAQDTEFCYLIFNNKMLANLTKFSLAFIYFIFYLSFSAVSSHYELTAVPLSLTSAFLPLSCWVPLTVISAKPQDPRRKRGFFTAARI